MAFLFMDSFDHYTLADITKVWTADGGAVASIAAGGRNSTSSARFNPAGAGSGHIYKSLSPGDTKFLACAAFKMSLFPSSTSRWNLISAQKGGATRFDSQVVVSINSSGEIEAWRGGNGGTLIAGPTVGAGITTGVYFHLSVESIIHDSTGTIKVAVNGVTVLNVGSLDTQFGTAGWDGVRIMGETANPSLAGSLSGTYDVDDVFVADGTGSISNSLLPDLRIDAVFPNANGNSNMSTPSTGTDRYATVDETTPNTTDYNTLVNVSDKDTFAVQNTPASGAPIRGVQVSIYAKKSDAGTSSICPVVRHSTTDNDGTTVALSTTYSYVRQVYENNPGTSAQWTESDFNAAEFGYKRTA